MKRILLTLVGVLALSAMVAAAATISYNTTYGPQGAGGSGSFGLLQFNPGLGTLTSVQLTVVGNSTEGSHVVENTSGGGGTATVIIGSNITVTGPSSLVVLTAPSQSNTGPVTAYDGTTDFLGTDALKVTGTTSTDTESASLTNPPTSLSAYIGLGNVTYNVTSTVNSFTSSNVSPTVAQTTSPNFNLGATVLYTFTDVPEPASITLFGLLGLGLLRRRR